MIPKNYKVKAIKKEIAPKLSYEDYENKRDSFSTEDTKTIIELNGITSELAFAK